MADGVPYEGRSPLGSHMTGFVRDLLELKAERDRLREALEKIAAIDPNESSAAVYRPGEIAREALSRPEKS